ncbi:hypothetical protein V6V47_22755 [Micromonospora sp. CPCC 205539]|uniref:hypothetical protein n=1 Tax=Micromonospora sp. CPCC 205539 TaxID=3122408 RepID=UPI002FF18A16
MPEPQPGAGRPDDGSTPGTEPDRDPAVADESASPSVPPEQPDPSDQPQPSDRPEPPTDQTADPADGPGPADEPRPTHDSGPADEPRPADGPAADGTAEAATAAAPAPKWSGSAPVPPPLPRRRAWGESAEPTPPQPIPAQPPEHQTPVDPWAGVDTGSWDLPHAELPPLPPTLSYPTPPQTRQWSGPPAPPVGPHPLPAAPQPPPVARPVSTPRPVSPPLPASPPRPVSPPAVPKQRRGRRTVAPPPVTPPPGWQPPQGYVPVKVRRRRRWPWLLLLTLACCCGCPAYYGTPIASQYPAQAALPEQVADLSLRRDDRSETDARRLKDEMRQQHLLAEDTFAGIYSTADGKRVTIFGDTGFRWNPEGDADSEITRLSERYKLGTPETVDTDVRGRHERCAVGRSAGSEVVVCTSVDHGSMATGVFARLSVSDSAALLDTLRAQIVTPKQS